jgi:uncharacterized protein (DUF58 family)
MWFQNIFSTANRHTRLHKQNQGQIEKVLDIPVKVLSQLDHLRLNTSRYLPGQGVGMRSSLRRRPASEFREHRMYVPGDDIRYVDWKASARQEHIFIKQGEYQKKINVHILIDCSASMKWGNNQKSTAALSLAAVLGYSALSHGDRLTITPLVEKSNHEEKSNLYLPLGPISGKGQFPGLLNYLRKLSFQGILNFSTLLKASSQRVLSTSGLVLLITDLLNNTPNFDVVISSFLKIFPSPSWNVIIFHLLHPNELIPTYQGEYEFFDIETNVTKNYDINPKALQTYQDKLQRWREEIKFECNDNNALYTLIQSNWSIGTEIIPLLRDLDILVNI